jgi:8-oxo-dGTP pyrophosphatase MutT (NUDIX family)
MSQAVKIIDWDEAGTVQAAGGVVTRPGPFGLVEVALIHRPDQDDWTLPKGKLEPGEDAETAALREVEEETGLECELVDPLGCTCYRDRRGRKKVVCYWEMHVFAGEFRPCAEVDRMRWVTVAEALELLSYAGDRTLLQSFETGP